MLAEAHRPRLHLVTDAARADGIVYDLGGVEEDVEGVVPVGMAQRGVAHLMVNSRVSKKKQGEKHYDSLEI